LLGNAGACLAIWMKATKFNFEPIAHAELSYARIKMRKAA
jgi:hypothetical protein